MGRAASRPPIGACWMVGTEENGENVTMRCPGNVTQVVSKKQIMTPQQMVAANMRRRQRCGMCSAPPAFKTPDGTTNMLAPEVGYGRPFRWETARMLAGERYTHRVLRV